MHYFSLWTFRWREVISYSRSWGPLQIESFPSLRKQEDGKEFLGSTVQMLHNIFAPFILRQSGSLIIGVPIQQYNCNTLHHLFENNRVLVVFHMALQCITMQGTISCMKIFLSFSCSPFLRCPGSQFAKCLHLNIRCGYVGHIQIKGKDEWWWWFSTANVLAKKCVE